MWSREGARGRGRCRRREKFDFPPCCAGDDIVTRCSLKPGKSLASPGIWSRPKRSSLFPSPHLCLYSNYITGCIKHKNSPLNPFISGPKFLENKEEERRRAYSNKTAPLDQEATGHFCVLLFFWKWNTLGKPAYTIKLMMFWKSLIHWNNMFHRSSNSKIYQVPFHVCSPLTHCIHQKLTASHSGWLQNGFFDLDFFI